MGIDTQLIEDATYFVVETPDGSEGFPVRVRHYGRLFKLRRYEIVARSGQRSHLRVTYKGRSRRGLVDASSCYAAGRAGSQVKRRSPSWSDSSTTSQVFTCVWIVAPSHSGWWSAPGAVGKATKNASPCVSTSTPPCAPNASRRMRRCSASAAAYPTAPSACSNTVEPSTSVNRKVTVPDERSRPTDAIMRQSKCHVTSGERAAGDLTKAPFAGSPR
jgi:hypothetical protein